MLLFICDIMNPLIKILIGALMVIVGVYSTVTFWNELYMVAKAGIGPLLVLIGAFIVWLESDEWKMRREHKEDSTDQYQQKFEVEKDQPDTDSEPDTGTTQQDVKEAVESEGHVCGECGREFDTQRGLSIHQSQKHG